MKAWMLAATLATSVGFTVGARADESATERTQAGDKASKAEATAEIMVAHGSNSGKGIDPKLARHEGRAVVFESLEDLANRVDDPKLDVAAGDVLVLKCAGPKGAPGMPEAGLLPIPKKLLAKGVRDVVRLSDDFGREGTNAP